MFRTMVEKVSRPVKVTIVLGSWVGGNWYVDQLLAKKIAWEMELDWEQKWALSKMEDNFELRERWLLCELEAEKKKRENKLEAGKNKNSES